MPVEMIRCPSCGSANSVKRTICFECEQRLDAPPPTPQVNPGDEPVKACKTCLQAKSFPPQGQKMGRDEVWCDKEGKAKPSTAPACNDYEAAFGWGKFEALD